MIVPYTELPAGAGGSPRPLLDLLIADMDDILVPCLVDSGALNTLLPAWIGEAAGIAIQDAPTKRLGVAGTSTQAAFVTTLLSVGGHSWEADVGFCDPWPYGWGRRIQTVSASHEMILCDERRLECAVRY